MNTIKGKNQQNKGGASGNVTAINEAVMTPMRTPFLTAFSYGILGDVEDQLGNTDKNDIAALRKLLKDFQGLIDLPEHPLSENIDDEKKILLKRVIKIITGKIRQLNSDFIADEYKLPKVVGNTVANMVNERPETLGGKRTRKTKKVRKHRGIVQTGGNKGKLKKGYKYTGKRLKNSLAEIKKVKAKK